MTTTPDGDAAAALAQLPSLARLNLGHCVPPLVMSPAASQLTSLVVHSRGAVSVMTSAVVAGALPPQLKRLEVTAEADSILEASLIQHALTSCPELTWFCTENAVDQQGLEAILAHGSKLEVVGVGRYKLQSSLAHLQCSSSTKVHLISSHGCDWPLTLSWLPNHMARVCSLPGVFQLPVPGVPAGQQQQILHTAASHLAERLQHGEVFGSRPVILKMQPGGGSQRFDWDLLHALSPLNGCICRLELGCTSRHTTLSFGTQAVAALCDGLGRKLTQLTLHHFNLDTSFWAALQGSLPKLEELRLQYNVKGAVSDRDMAEAVRRGLKVSRGFY
jgi:hypothetical protein